ncbi:MAK10-like protein [Tanacetum coccineum]
MERFEEAIDKQRKEINQGMTEMLSLLKELTKGKSLEKALVREEVSKPITKYVNATSLVRVESDKDMRSDEIVDKNIIEPIELVDKDESMNNEKDNESDRSENMDSTRWGKYVDRLIEVPRSQPIGYYLKHKINEKTIEGLIDNHKYNDSLLATRLGKIDNETYNSLPVGPMDNAILKKKLAKKDGIGGNFVIPCSIGKLKFMNALADQGSDVNIMPLSIYNKLTSEKPIGTNIRLSLANHSYKYPLGVEDVLIDVDGFVYPVDFVILDIEEDECMPLILGTPFLTIAKAEIKFDKGPPEPVILKLDLLGH